MDFQIKVKAQVNVQEIIDNLKTIEQHKFKLSFDLSGLKTQLDSIFSNYKVDSLIGGGARQGGAGVRQASGGAMTQADITARNRRDAVAGFSSDLSRQTITTTYDAEGEALQTVIRGYDELNQKTAIRLNAENEISTVQVTEGEQINKNVESYEKLNNIIANLEERGKITAEQAGQLRSELNGIDAGQSKDLSNDFNNLKTHISDAQSATTKLNSQLQQNERSYSKITQRLQTLQKNGQLTTKQVGEFTQRLEAARKETDQFKQQTLFQEITRDITDANHRVVTLGDSFKSAFRNFSLWSVASSMIHAMVRALKDVVTQVVALDKAFTNLRLVTQDSVAQTEALRKEYFALAQEMGVTVDTITDGADEFLRAGLNATEAIDALRASITLTTVGNMEATQATQYLIAAMNAYKLEASELMGVVDKLSAVDIQAATSSEDLGEALSISASSATLAGVEMDRLLGYITAVQEVTQESASVIGNFYTTLFARMQKVNIGSLVDEDGESISDVDKTLKQYGITIRDTTGDLKDVSVILDEVNQKWGALTTAQKSEIATAIAGTR